MMQTKRRENGVELIDKALAIKPDYVEAIFNRALLFLLTGDFGAGWSGYESRWDKKDAPSRKLGVPFPNWRGDIIRGKKIIVYEEQGLGDIIQFSRNLIYLAELGAHVTFLVRPGLVELMRPFTKTVRVLSDYPARENFDYQSALLSLPLAVGATLEGVSAETPYLRAEPERARKWKDRLGEQGIKIGIAWLGSKAGMVDLG